MPCTSCAESNGVSQNVHGPKPSLTQMTFPQFKQFGAAASRGCRAPIQLQRRLAAGSMRDVFVDISSARIAESRVDSVDEAPCIDCPPVSVTFVVVAFFGAGDAFRDGFWEALREEELDLVLNSEIREPAAEGGGRVIGACTAAGLAESEGPSLTTALCDDLCAI